ncbi:Putative cell wall binding repeat 2 [Peptostreptococcus sp. D1]|nr:Putative cell wall binding repeat 2 [Peptostreptococcus sp. D1]
MGNAVIASGENFPDALTVGPFEAEKVFPILLVDSNKLPKVIKDTISELQIKKVTIAGGYNSVAKALEASLPTVSERLSKSSRYETATEIASKKFSKFNEIFVANGQHWMDALVIGPVAGTNGTPILLTQANSLPKSLKDFISKTKVEKISTLGGKSIVSEKILKLTIIKLCLYLSHIYLEHHLLHLISLPLVILMSFQFCLHTQ